MKRHCTYMYFVIIGYGGEYERVIVDRWPRFCMKEKRSSRNSFLFGSGDMSYSCTLTHIITLSSKQTNRTKVNLTCQQFDHNLSTTSTKMQSKTADFVPGAVTWRTRRNIHRWFGLFPPLHEIMTSSTKPEVHNVSHCRQRRTEPRLWITCT